MFRKSADKPPPANAEIDELKQLLATARQEGQSLMALSDKLADQGAEIKALAKDAARVEKSITQASAKLDGLQTKVARVETVGKTVADLDSLVQVLDKTLKDANQTAERLMAPEGELQKQRLAAQALSAHALQTRASLDALRADQERVDKLRGELGLTIDELQRARTQAASAAAEVGVVRAAVTELTKEQQAIRDTAREARDDATAASSKLLEVDQKLSNLPKLQELARTLEDRIAGLNTTVEHVMQRTKVLDQQKLTVERAIIDGHRLGGMVTAMEGQVARLEEGRRQAASVEDTVDRIEVLVREAGQGLDEAQRKRDSMTSDLERLDRDRNALIEFVGKYEERLGAERRELEASSARASALEVSLQQIEKAQQSVAEREKHLAAMSERINVLEAQLSSTVERADEAGRKIEIVEVLKQDLLRVDEMARKATWQMESLKSARTDLEELRAEVQAFYKEHAEAVQLRDRLSADRVALEGFLDRASAFSITLPELDARLNGVRANWPASMRGPRRRRTSWPSRTISTAT